MNQPQNQGYGNMSQWQQQQPPAYGIPPQQAKGNGLGTGAVVGIAVVVLALGIGGGVLLRSMTSGSGDSGDHQVTVTSTGGGGTSSSGSSGTSSGTGTAGASDIDTSKYMSYKLVPRDTEDIVSSTWVAVPVMSSMEGPTWVFGDDGGFTLWGPGSDVAAGVGDYQTGTIEVLLDEDAVKFLAEYHKESIDDAAKRVFSQFDRLSAAHDNAELHYVIFKTTLTSERMGGVETTFEVPHEGLWDGMWFPDEHAMDITAVATANQYILYDETARASDDYKARIKPYSEEEG